MILLWDEFWIRLTLGLLGSYFLVITLMQILLQALSYRRHQQRLRPTKSVLPSLTLLVPAHNEAEVVVEALNRSLQLPLDKFDIIVIENASTDQTYPLLQEMFQLHPETANVYRSITHPRLRMLRTPTPGKALALNLALPYVTTDIVATMDADTIPEIRGLETLLREFQARPHLLALGGIVRVMDPERLATQPVAPPRALPFALQSLEYLRAFSGERLGWGCMKASVYMSGACALFRTPTLKARGGFQIDSVTEDLETSLDLIASLKGPHPIDILPTVVAWTQVPHNLAGLFRQRRRWQAGLCQCLWKYRKLFCQPRYGAAGMVALPYIFLTEALGPLMEFFALGLIALSLYCNWLTVGPVLVIALLGFGLSAFLLVWTAALENRMMPQNAAWPLGRVLFLSLPLNLIHRPLVNLVRLEATLRFPWLKSWGVIQRRELKS